jgi:hypothetical protein
VAFAAPVFTGSATLTLTTGEEHLDGHPVTDADAPSLGRPGADLLDDADGLVSGDEGVGAGEVSGVQLVIGAAQPAGLDAQEPVYGSDIR